MSVNKVLLLGNFGQDPQIKEGKSDYCRFSIATTHKYKNESETEWHSCVAFGKTAQAICQYFQKGDPIYIEGRIKSGEYKDKPTFSIIVEQFSFVGGQKSTKTEAKEDEDLPF